MEFNLEFTLRIDVPSYAEADALAERIDSYISEQAGDVEVYVDGGGLQIRSIEALSAEGLRQIDEDEARREAEWAEAKAAGALDGD